MIAKEQPQEIIDEFERLRTPIEVHADPHASLKHAFAGLKYASQLNWEWGIARSHASIAVCYANSGELESAKKHYEIALANVENLDPIQALITKTNYANLLSENEPARAFGIHHEVYEQAVANNAPNRIAFNALVGQGVDYHRMGSMELYIDYMLQALQLDVEKDSKGSNSIAHMNLVNAFALRNDLEQALEHCQKAIEIEVKLGHLREVAVNKPSLSEIYCRMGQTKKAETIARQALDEARSLHLEDYHAAQVLAEALTQQGKIKEAIPWFEHAILSTSIEHKTHALLSFGKALLRSDSERSYQILSDLLLAQERGNKYVESGLHLSLSDWFTMNDQPIEALTQLKKHYEIRDRIFTEHAQRQLLAFRIEQEVKKHQAEARELRIVKSHLEEQLQTKMIQHAEQTDILATLREDLRRIIRKIEVRDPAINELIAKLKELPEAVNWKEFEEQFLQVHPEFKSNLKKKFPELSEDELHVAALFRLKLKSPDIGKLLSISWRTVQNRRNRIRKKLGLKSEDDIAKFLGGF